MCGNWDLAFEVFNEWEVWNLITNNCVMVRFNNLLKMRVVDVCQWMKIKEMFPNSAKNTQNQKDLIKQTVMVILAPLKLA
ncbi:hypothetical protein QL285_044529 [Trifolium repens]|nr:hypothetical protein QL285_044529 [Trifolium repens]